MMNESSKKKRNISVRVIKARDHISKADTSVQLDRSAEKSPNEWIPQPVVMAGLEALVDNSTIIPQCIKAYKNNIAGFGLIVDYKDFIKEEDESEAHKKEYDEAVRVIELLNMDMDTKEVFEKIVAMRETYGIAYLEVVRGSDNRPIEIYPMTDVPSITKSIPLDPAVQVTYYHDDKTIIRHKQFRRYKQTIGANTIYFKEFGDPRAMDSTTGEYVENLQSENQANEILEFKLGDAPYGKVRWVGQVLGASGCRASENLNVKYFEEGRHTPLMIMVKNGTLSDESFEKLENYMGDIKGENGQHAFLLLELEGDEGRAEYEDSKPDVEIKELVSVLQKDELFQGYHDNTRRRIQSAFQLPDIYVGFTTDFNRATAQMAMEVTEQQVFQPERISLAWAINNKLLAEYDFKYVEVNFNAPSITNPDDLSKILTITERAGGLTPNRAKELTQTVLGGETEPYPEDWGNKPVALTRNIATAQVAGQLDSQIVKAEQADDAEVVAVMKSVRDLLVKIREDGDET